MIYDAAVIGAGPAGSSAAICLASAGLKTVLIEKTAAPRHKVCGEFFSPGAWPFFERLGITQKMLQAGGRAVWAAALFFPSQKPLLVDFPEVRQEYPFAFALSRYAFDEILFRRAAEAGCDILAGNEVQSVTENADGCSVKLARGTEIRAMKVIMAAGKTHRFQAQKPGNYVGFKAHFQNMRKPAGLEMHFFRGGYLGLLEIEKSKVNLCGMLDRKLLKACGGNFENALAHASEKNPALRSWLGSAIRVTPWLSCVTPRGFQGKDTSKIFHTGDSRCFVEPMIGQGMTLAMLSGISAADRLAGKTNSDDAKKNYRNKLNILKPFEPAVRLCSRFPSLSGPAAKILLTRDRIRRILAID